MPKFIELFEKWEETTFDVTCTMDKGSVPHFLSMLGYMEQLGSMGSSRRVSFYADGDGNFRPTFKWDKSLPSEAEPVEDDDGDRTYDPG